MKIHAISRDPNLVLPQSGDQQPVFRNLDPSAHPFQRAREYTRALNATKLNRLFAKPFIGQLGTGHVDGVYCISRDPQSIIRLASASGDGVVKLWDIAEKSEIKSFQAHEGIVRGLCFTKDSDIMSCSADKTIKLFSTTSDDSNAKEIYTSTDGLTGIDHKREESLFATSSSSIKIWDFNRSLPINDLNWDADSFNCLKFNPAHSSLLVASDIDRSIILCDLRYSSPVAKAVLSMSSTSLCFNPQEPFNFVAACEDHNVYHFDMRNLKRNLNVYKGHVNAVMSVDFSPTGKHIVTGSYDRSIRIFNYNSGNSHDIYHTKRMQRVFSVQFTSDSKYVVSGSDDGNLRLWRANASESSSVKSSRMRRNLEYSEALRKKFRHMPEIARIDRHRHIPQTIKSAAATKRIQEQSIKQKESNRRKHSKPGAVPFQSEREKAIVKVME